MTATGGAPALDATRVALDAIAARDGAIRAFTRIDAKGALAAAEASDRRRGQGMMLGPLDGVPVAVKDNLAIAGLPCPAGTRILSEEHAMRDATVVARLRRAGAVIIGMLNMDEGALGATTDNPWWGRCDNPRVPGHTPGGSSGGSAAAVAAGFVPVALGTDTMGSVRIPAAYCGLWGLKPSRGLVPVSGLVHLSWTLDTIGPLARDPDHLIALLDVIAGPDPAEFPSAAWPPAEEDAPARLTGARFAVPSDDILASSEPEVIAAHRVAVAAAENAGATIVPLALDWDPGRLRRAGLLVCEAEAAAFLADEITRTPERFSESFRAALAYGAEVSGLRLALAYRLLAEAATATRRSLIGIDAILLPAAPQRAFPHGVPAPKNQADFTALANIAGLPAVVFPIAATDGGAPASVQLIGPPFADRHIVDLARLLEERIAA